MPVYVDDMKATYGRMRMCHMIADTRAELDGMADFIGVKRQHIQHEGTWREHYDISMTKREIAVRAGAIQLTQRELVQRLIKKRNSR